MKTSSEMIARRAAERRLSRAIDCLRVAGLCLVIAIGGLVGGAIIAKAMANYAADQARCADGCGDGSW